MPDGYHKMQQIGTEPGKKEKENREETGSIPLGGLGQMREKEKDCARTQTQYYAHHDGCIIDQVAASQLTSSKLCSMVKPIDERQSKLPSPSTYLGLASRLSEEKRKKRRKGAALTQSITTVLAFSFRIWRIANKIKPCITVE